MAHLGGGVGEGPLAVVTMVGLLSTVHQLMALQVARGGEELAAVLAAVARLARVPFAMEVQQADLPVALTARCAAVRLHGAEPIQPWPFGKGDIPYPVSVCTKHKQRNQEECASRH